MSKIHVSSAGKKEDLILFSCNFHLLQKVSVFLCQIQNFTPDNLDIEPVGPILYRNNQLIQIIRYVEDWMYISKVTLKNHVKMKIMALSVTWDAGSWIPAKQSCGEWSHYLDTATQAHRVTACQRLCTWRQTDNTARWVTTKLYTLHHTQTRAEAEKYWNMD